MDNSESQTPRRLEQVSILAPRKTVITWMIQDESVHGLPGFYQRTICAFPKHSRGLKSANVVRASRWWKMRGEFCIEGGEEETSMILSTTRSCFGSCKRLHSKVAPGRGNKRPDWILWIYPRLLTAFEQYKKAVVIFSSKLLIELALLIFLDQTSPYTAESRDPKDNRLVVDKLTHCWMQQFMDVHNIVLLIQRGRLSCSPDKEVQIEMHIAFHLGVLQRGFQSGIFNENLMENLNETHFVVNMDNGRTLGFREDDTVKYADMVSRGESMIMVVRTSGGCRAMIEAPIMIFTNANCSYPMRVLPDNIPSVSYRMGMKGWMDQNLFPEYFLEPHLFQADIYGRTKFVWVDNCSSHNMTPKLSSVLAAKQTTLKYLPQCSTHLCQPADTFIISKIKDAWTRRWEAKKIELIQMESWQNSTQANGQWSGKLTNPGKLYFLQLAADSVEDVNKEIDCDNISYARKAMIRCGFSLAIDGTWSIGQLFLNLQEIISKHEPQFRGKAVPI